MKINWQVKCFLISYYNKNNFLNSKKIFSFMEKVRNIFRKQIWIEDKVVFIEFRFPWKFFEWIWGLARVVRENWNFMKNYKHMNILRIKPLILFFRTTLLFLANLILYICGKVENITWEIINSSKWMNNPIFHL